MRTVALLLLLLGAGSSARAAEKTHEEKMVEYFVKTPIADLPPENINEFMAVDPAKLPAKLRPKFEARKLELQTLKQLAEGKKKGLVRTPEKACEVPEAAKSQDPRALLLAGYTEIEDSDERCVMDRTGCTERDMLCEFSLQIVVLHHPKTGKVIGRRLFLYPTDPLFGIIGACRKNTGGNTNFFGGMYMSCSH